MTGNRIYSWIRLTRGISFVLIVMFLLWSTVFVTYVLLKQEQKIVHHMSLVEHLQKCVDDKGAVPDKLGSCDDGEMKYYPQAWGKPGTILLKSEVSGSYVVTFGDKAISVLTYWKSGSAGSGMENKRLSLRSVGGDFFPATFFICMVVVFFGSIAAGIVLKRKTGAGLR